MKTRHTKLKVIYNGSDISADISANLLQFTFTDNAGDKADEVRIVLEDRDQLWRDAWYPSKGAKLKCYIQPEHDAELPCGEFEIDEIEISGPPSKVSIKAVSVPITKPIRGEKKTRTWEGADLQKVGAEVASAAGLSFEWFGGKVPTYQRIDQTEESDLGFLSRLGRDVNHRVKVADGRLVIWDEAEYSSRGPTFTVDVGLASAVTSYQFSSKSHDTYKAARVRYHDPVKKIDIDYTETSSQVETGQTLEINRRVESVEQARTLAQKELESKNKLEVTGTVEMMGVSNASAGLITRIVSVGRLSGNYMIDTAGHTVTRSGGWTVSLNIHRVQS